MNRAYLKLCDKAHLPVDALQHWPETEQPTVIMGCLQRHKAARGYTLASIAAILEAERNEPPITGTPIHAPGLGQAVSGSGVSRGGRSEHRARPVHNPR